MKKLKLSAPTFQNGEVLTRAQLKKVLGGDGSGGEGDLGRCYTHWEDRICTFIGKNGTEVPGECSPSDNGSQCRCVAWTGDESVPDAGCIRPV